MKLTKDDKERLKQMAGDVCGMIALGLTIYLLMIWGVSNVTIKSKDKKRIIGNMTMASMMAYGYGVNYQARGITEEPEPIDESIIQQRLDAAQAKRDRKKAIRVKRFQAMKKGES